MRDVRRCIKAGADVDHLDERTGFAALHHAAWNGHIAAVRLLLASGADASVRNHIGETAAASARIAGHAAIVELLESDDGRVGGAAVPADSPAPALAVAPAPTAAAAAAAAAAAGSAVPPATPPAPEAAAATREEAREEAAAAAAAAATATVAAAATDAQLVWRVAFDAALASAAPLAPSELATEVRRLLLPPPLDGDDTSWLSCRSKVLHRDVRRQYRLSARGDHLESLSSDSAWRVCAARGAVTCVRRLDLFGDTFRIERADGAFDAYTCDSVAECVRWVAGFQDAGWEVVVEKDEAQ